MNVKGALTAFQADTRAVVAVEFGLIGALVVGLVLETMQGGLFLYQQASMERATAIAARQVMIGAASASSMTAAQFAAQVVCPALPAGIKCANVTIDSEVVSEDTAPNGFYAYAATDMSRLVAMPAASAATFCTGTSGSVVYMRISYLSVAISPAWIALARANSTALGGLPAYRVTAYAAFRNEPFQGSNSGC